MSDIDVDAKVAFPRRPEAYSEVPRTVTAIQTHLSWVFLTDARSAIFGTKVMTSRCATIFGMFLIFLALFATLLACAQSSYEAQRNALAVEIERNVRETRSYTGRSRPDAAVIKAIRTVPRHEFVPVEWRDYSYANEPLPIGEGQTISQPHIVALMTELADVGPDSTVLEVGTGSGYQAAVLAEIVAHVYTIEIVGSLGRRAAQTLERLSYENVTVRIGDGYRVWPELAPFDAIVVTAAPEAVPPPLIEQLRVGRQARGASGA